MTKRITKSYAGKIAQPPGTLVHVGERMGLEPRISLIDYTSDGAQVLEVSKVADLMSYVESPSVSWVNVIGLHDTHLLEEMGKHFNIHSMTLEDILNTAQRPKIELFDDMVFFVIKMIRWDGVREELEIEQVSLLLGPRFVITFQEKEGDVLDLLRERIRQGKGRIRQQGADYLFYAIIDVIVDHYFVCLELLGDYIEDAEETALDRPDPALIINLHRIKRELLFLRKSIWPLREQITSLIREEHALITPGVRRYMRDIYDHTIQVIDTVETFRDMVSGLRELYLSSLSNRMNEIMKVLTIIATIFIPLTFLAGVYGMNFEYMPELHWPWAYPAILGLFVSLAVGMVLYFKRRKWL